MPLQTLALSIEDHVAQVRLDRPRALNTMTLSMARAADPNSADSQFFIVFKTAPWLDGQYTMWGQVTDGMDAVDKIKMGAPGSGTVTDPDKIISMRMAADSE